MALLLDLSAMQPIRVDPRRRIADAEGGNTWATYDRETSRSGLASPGAVDPTTGIGVSLSGGVEFGLPVALAWQATTASPSMSLHLRASCSESMRNITPSCTGACVGGGNFGAITSFRYRLRSVNKVLGTVLMWDVGRAPEVTTWFDENGPGATRPVWWWNRPVPDRRDGVHTRRTSGRSCSALYSCWSGDSDLGEKLLHRLTTIAPPILQLAGRRRYRQQQRQSTQAQA